MPLLVFVLTLNYNAEYGFLDIDCQRNYGKTYRGNVRVTREGLKCKPWNSTGSFSYLGSISYCRNPGPADSAVGGAWCYTDSYHTVWGFCHIRQCHCCDIGKDQPALLKYIYYSALNCVGCMI